MLIRAHRRRTRIARPVYLVELVEPEEDAGDDDHTADILDGLVEQGEVAAALAAPKEKAP